MRRAAVLLVLAAGCSDDEPPVPVAGPAAGPAAGIVAPGAGPATIRFRDVTRESGVDFRHQAGFTPEKHLPEEMGHGAALFDVEGDGDLDLYLVQGGPLVRGATDPPGPVSALYTNRGDGTFVDATSSAGAAAHEGYGMGVAVGDADGDGAVDLLVTCFGPDALCLGDGRGGFRAGAPELADERWTTSAAFFDAELDGDLDLYVAAYVQVDLEHPTWCGRHEPGWRTVCHPDHYPGLQDRFWRNRGDASFEDATESAGVADSWGKGLGVVATDLDADGLPDVYVANDSTENRLWHNTGGGRFVDATLLSGTGVDVNGMTEAGMGLAAGDVDGDGDFELYKTNFDDESATLYVNQGELLFTDGTIAAGIEGPTRLPVGFGCVLADFDDDSDLDVAVVNGHIIDVIHLYDEAQTWAQRAQLFVNDGSGRFVDGSLGAGDLCSTPRVGRGLSCGDLDGDGDLDLVATECGGPTVLLRNESAGGRAVVLDGVPRGARVEASFADGSRQVREAGPQPSYLSQTEGLVHLGLGRAENRLVGLSIAWRRNTQSVPLPRPLGAGRYWLEGSERGWRIKIP